VGNLHQLDITQLHIILERWANKYGTLYTFKMGTKQVVAIADPDLIHRVLRQRPETYRRLSTVAPVFTEMGLNGVFSAEGEQWYRQRRVAMHALNTSHLRRFFPTLAKVTARLKARWDRAAATGRAVEVQQDLICFAVDVTTELAFGYDINTLEEAGGSLQQHLEKIMPMVNRRVFAPFPYWHFVKLPADRVLDEALAALHNIIADLIAQSRIRLAHNTELATGPSNFLEAMLMAHDEEERLFSEEEIAGNVLTMLVAGEDTTANTMTWMAHFMTEYPEVQQRMQREVDEVLEKAPMLQHFPDHERLIYVEAMAHETLRLKSVGPLLFQETNQPVDLDGMHLPADTIVALLTRSGGLQDNAFIEAEQFRPERWLALPEGVQHEHNPSAMMPFGSGPRFCPGRSLALLEIKAVMAMLCRNFSISRTPLAKPVGEHYAFVVRPTNVFVNFRRREGLGSA
jgi:cytochrome P450